MTRERERENGSSTKGTLYFHLKRHTHVNVTRQLIGTQTWIATGPGVYWKPFIVCIANCQMSDFRLCIRVTTSRFLKMIQIELPLICVPLCIYPNNWFAFMLLLYCESMSLPRSQIQVNGWAQLNTKPNWILYTLYLVSCLPFIFFLSVCVCGV